MRIQKILTVNSQEKKELQVAIGHISDLFYAGEELCSDMECSKRPFHQTSYVCPIGTLSSNNIEDLEEFINQLPVAEEG